MSKNDSAQIQRLTFWLSLLILAASIMTVGEDTMSFFTDKPIALFIDGELWTKRILSFAVKDRLVLFGILNAKTVMWLVALYQIWRLCRLYSQAIFLRFKMPVASLMSAEHWLGWRYWIR